MKTKLHLILPRATEEPSPLKILIVSTPKTGNTWLQSLLSEIYNLPEASLISDIRGLGVPYEFDRDKYDTLGDSWITHRHLWPTTSWLNWISERGVILLTTMRHPGDVLVSQRHYIKRYAPSKLENPNAYAMLDDGDSMGEHTLRYVQNHFYKDLHLSILWARLGARVIRFEDQITDPVATMKALTDSFCPVPVERIHKAVVLCEIRRLRASLPDQSFHFRRGIVGEWREVLPKEIVDTFRSQAPYPAQFAALGYSLDETQPSPREPFSYETIDPFRGASEFDNGVPIPGVVVRLYMLHISKSSDRWPNPTCTAGGDSYFEWLNARCDEDRGDLPETIRVTNLANEIYKIRPDVQRDTPDHLGKNRFEFIQWFLLYAIDEYKLPSAFSVPIFTSAAGERLAMRQSTP